jgi:predicted ATP-dependent endonuclease of OLD family
MEPIVSDWRLTVERIITMKLTRIHIISYRSIESLELTFPSYYSALCGKNNSGKTNVVKAIHSLFKEETPYFEDDEPIVFKKHFPMWKAKDKECKISICYDFTITSEGDA